MDPAAIKFPPEFHGRAFVARFGQLETGVADVGRDVLSMRLDDANEGLVVNRFLRNMGRAIDVLCAYNGKLYIVEFSQDTTGFLPWPPSTESRLHEISYTIPLDVPNIQLNPTTITHNVGVNATLPDEPFTVTNNGGGELVYTVSDNATWLSVSPTDGTSTGEGDMITISYDLTGLSCGANVATITVSDPLAVNDPQTLTVTVNISSIKPDFDCDCDVDQADFGVFQACLSPVAGQAPPPGCDNARLDLDSDVDAGDMAVFLNCMSTSGVCADPDCLP
jgi:hypothetical protein